MSSKNAFLGLQSLKIIKPKLEGDNTIKSVIFVYLIRQIPKIIFSKNLKIMKMKIYISALHFLSDFLHLIPNPDAWKL